MHIQMHAHTKTHTHTYTHTIIASLKDSFEFNVFVHTLLCMCMIAVLFTLLYVDLFVMVTDLLATLFCL